MCVFPSVQKASFWKRRPSISQSEEKDTEEGHSRAGAICGEKIFNSVSEKLILRCIWDIQEELFCLAKEKILEQCGPCISFSL